MSETGITIKLSAGEYKLLLAEMKAHVTDLEAMTRRIEPPASTGYRRRAEALRGLLDDLTR